MVSILVKGKKSFKSGSLKPVLPTTHPTDVMLSSFIIIVIILASERRNSHKNETIIHFKFSSDLKFCCLKLIYKWAWEPLFEIKCRKMKCFFCAYQFTSIVHLVAIFGNVRVNSCFFVHSVNSLFLYLQLKEETKEQKSSGQLFWCCGALRIFFPGCFPSKFNQLTSFYFCQKYEALQFTTAIVMFTMAGCFLARVWGRLNLDHP